MDHLEEKRYQQLEEFNRDVLDTVNIDRHKQHGDFFENHKNIADFWNIILRKKLKEQLTASDISSCMIALKFARTMAPGYNADNYLDLAGYAGITKILKQIENGDLYDTPPE